MSYEGYSQCICSNGHYFEHDAYCDGFCPYCGLGSSWDNSVDQTNGEAYGEIPLNLLKNKFLIKERAIYAIIDRMALTWLKLNQIPSRQ
jgi:hypothetical protein